MNLSKRAPEVILSNAGLQGKLPASRDANRLSSAVDVWSLGMLFYHVLTGISSPYVSCNDSTSVLPFEENARIVDGDFDLSPLEHAGELC
jgi:serine/threonine protein kinase